MNNKPTRDNVPFAQISNAVLYDKRISFKAKGVYAYIYAKPVDWDFNAKRIAKETTDGERAVLSALKELEDVGLLTRKKLPSGRMEYYLHIPEPNVGNRNQAKLQLAKTASIINKEFNKQRVKENTFSDEKDFSQVEDIEYDTNVDPETGEPLKDSFGRKKGTRPVVKKKAYWLMGEFDKACKKHLDFTPDKKKGWYYVAVDVVKKPWITKKLMQQHIHDWFMDQSKTDEEVISFTACFSTNQMNKLKLSTVRK